MGEEMARALGASSTNTVMIGGKECVAKPLGIKELTEVERDCLQRYKRDYLETYAQNLDLIPEDQRLSIVERKMDEVAKWTLDNLPTKRAHDQKRVQVTDALKKWLADAFDVRDDRSNEQWRRLAATALDQETLSSAEYKALTGGQVPPEVRVPYVNWWITGSFDGMISFVWVCFRHNGVTRDQIIEHMSNNLSLLVETAHEIERLSAPQPGNG